MQKRVLLASVTAGAALALFASPVFADAASDGLALAKANLAPYSAKPVFTAPGDPFDAKACAAGKKMMSIPNNSGNPFLKGIIDRMKAAGADVGLQVVEGQNQGTPAEWVQQVELATRDKYNIIDLISGIDPGSIEPSLQAAKDAGVKVMTSHFYDPSFEQNKVVSSSLTIGFGEIGKILADWATVATDGNPQIAIIVSRDVPPTIPLIENFQKELAAVAPNGKIVQEINVGVTEWGTKIQPGVQAALQANPDINVVIPIYDSMSQFVVPAIRLAGKTGAVKVATFNGTPFVLDYIQSGEVDMDIGESLDWIAYATIDGHLRDACGLPTPTALNVPFYIFDKANAAEAGTPAAFDTGYGDAYKSGFRKLWGIE
ncbi:sugar ABC transporter substrate-binding protein [Devosia sp.]|uniref:sugar ABC transporter substrate-binding protein n=1 Tax=Devosia sp. TaxID=1871048 RepID=UPI003BAC427B